MRSAAEHARVMTLIERGLNNSEIAREMGIARPTVRDWRHGRGVRHKQRRSIEACGACGHPAHDYYSLPTVEYPYLLGMYLGDGHISRYPRAWRLRITLDMAWPGIILRCLNAMQAVFPENKVSL